jgi:hypothetical protein
MAGEQAKQYTGKYGSVQSWMQDQQTGWGVFCFNGSAYFCLSEVVARFLADNGVLALKEHSSSLFPLKHENPYFVYRGVLFTWMSCRGSIGTFNKGLNLHYVYDEHTGCIVLGEEEETIAPFPVNLLEVDLRNEQGDIVRAKRVRGSG